MKAILLATTLTLLSATGQAAELPEAAKACVACHGDNGVAVTAATPHLNGQLRTYLVETIVRLQKGRRSSSINGHVPPDMSPETIDAIASFYAGIKAQRPKQETDPAKVVRGNNIYLARCADCHADAGRIGDDEAPIMNAQNLDHLLTQGKAYTSGQRKFVEPLMRDAYKGLREEDIEAIAHYLAAIEQYPGEGKKKRRR
jgi:cytochrome c553